MTAPVTLIADLFPGAVTLTETGVRPEGVPKSAKLHVIVSTTEIAIGWDMGSYDGSAQIGEVRLDIAEFDNTGLTHNGGQVGPYTIQRAGGCSCGKALKRWNPYAGQPMTQLARSAAPTRTGLPQRYSRN